MNFWSSIDVTEVLFYLFVAFFLGLVWYLRREDKREGYPLVTDRQDASGRNIRIEGWPGMPETKTFLVDHGHGPEVLDPTRADRDISGIAATHPRYSGEPIVPLGDPMQLGLGPAAWANRADVVELTFEGRVPKIVPLRADAAFGISNEDLDPRGLTVMAADGVAAGTVVDLWVDRSEYIIRFLEVETSAETGTPARRVLVPMTLATFYEDPERVRRMLVKVRSVMARQLAAAPAPKAADRLTLLEEDKIAAYFAGGHLLADPKRAEPVF